MLTTLGSQGGLDFSFFIPPDPVRTILLAGVIPGAVATAMFVLVWWRASASDRAQHDDASEQRPIPAAPTGRLIWLVPLVLAGIAVFAEIVIRGWPQAFFPVQVGKRFVVLAAGLAVAGLIQALVRPRWLGLGLAVVFASASIIGTLIEPRLRPDHDRLTEALLSGGVVMGVLALLICGLDWAHQRSRGWLIPAATLPAFALAGPVLVLSNTAPAAQLSAVLPAVVSAAVLVACIRPGLTLGRGGWAVLVGWHVALVFYNMFWAFRGLHPLPAAAIALAPVGGLACMLPRVRAWPTLLRLALGGGLSLALALAALIPAYLAAAEQADSMY